MFMGQMLMAYAQSHVQLRGWFDILRLIFKSREGWSFFFFFPSGSFIVASLSSLVNNRAEPKQIGFARKVQC